MRGCIPKNHENLYFDTLVRTAKSESVLSLIHASYHASRIRGIQPNQLKKEICKRLEFAYDLFRDNVRGSDSGSGSYDGSESQFESQYTIGLELAIWRNQELELNNLAIKVAENRITIRDYFDLFFSNYVQPINEVNVHPMYSILKYMDEENVNVISKDLLPEVLSIGETDSQYINALFYFLSGTNCFEYDGSKNLIYSSNLTKGYFLNRCDTQYIGSEGYKLFVHDIGDDRDAYISYVTKDNTNELRLEPINEDNYLAADPNEEQYIFDARLGGGCNILFYGVPGSGKSFLIENEYSKDAVVERVVFHPDYTNADFVGQILPVLDSVTNMVSYKYVPGPFTNIVKNAYENPHKKYVLIIEEINRGNAPAIFGDVFQLLDRTMESLKKGTEVFPVGTSEYGINNSDMAKIIYNDPNHLIYIPSNLSLFATMNTSDQNVFTLDTAFQRRWNMRLIENTFTHVRPSLALCPILDTHVNWKSFCECINNLILKNKSKMGLSEDKRLGVYFIHSEDDLKFDDNAVPSEEYSSIKEEYDKLLDLKLDGSLSSGQSLRLDNIFKSIHQNGIFAEKVIKYLWDDVFKYSLESIFNIEQYQSLDDVISSFIFNTEDSRFDIFNNSVKDALLNYK